MRPEQADDSDSWDSVFTDDIDRSEGFAILGRERFFEDFDLHTFFKVFLGVFALVASFALFRVMVAIWVDSLILLFGVAVGDILEGS